MMTVKDWCLAVGMSRSAFYLMREELRPLRRSGCPGLRRLVIESPADWRNRVGGHGFSAESAGKPAPSVDVEAEASYWEARAKVVGIEQALREKRSGKRPG